jgi:hypothetical protein
MPYFSELSIHPPASYLNNDEPSSKYGRDWTKSVNNDERKNICEKLKAVYRKKAPTYEALLEICSAIEEEFLLSEAPSRLDYIKSGVQFERRVANKICRLRCCPVTSNHHTPQSTTHAFTYFPVVSVPESAAVTATSSNPSSATAATQLNDEDNSALVLAMMCQLSQYQYMPGTSINNTNAASAATGTNNAIDSTAGGGNHQSEMEEEEELSRIKRAKRLL